MRISDWSSDVCSSDLDGNVHGVGFILDDLEAGNALDVFGAVTDIAQVDLAVFRGPDKVGAAAVYLLDHRKARAARAAVVFRRQADAVADVLVDRQPVVHRLAVHRSEEHTSNLQQLIRNSYAVF